MTAERGFVIGIDLGTTYSCAAIAVDNGEVTVIKNELGQFTTPSHVAFESDKTTLVSQAGNFPKITVGDAAKFQSSVPPENSVYDVKRIIGRKFDDPVVQEDIHLWPFKVISVDNNPRIEVNGKLYHPEQISSMVLKYVKQQVELSLGGPVTDAVITVPAYFTDGQRQATKDAGSIAGLNVLRIINEPTAAAIAYNHQLRTHSVGTTFRNKRNVLIFDLGGGTFDLSLLTMEGDKIEVKAVDGDTHLGGQDFDNKMMDYCIQQFQEKHKIDLSKCLPNSQIPTTNQGGAENEKFELGKRLRRIKNACELKKVHLSSTRQVQISLEVIYEKYDLNVKMKRETFDSINKSYFDKCLEIVERILSGAGMKKEEIDDVVLVGGSSRIPRVCKMVQDFFGGKALCKNIKQDEAVAYGAAVQANIMTSTKGSSSQSTTVFTDVTPHSIGIQIKVDEGVQEDFSVILKKNTKVPCNGTKKYYTSSPNQKSVRIGVYEGQSVSVKENDLLGEFFLENLPPNCPKGETIDLFMGLNEEGILEVKAECPASKATNDITVKALKGRLKQEEVDQYQLRMEELFISTTTTEWGTILS